MSPEARLEVAIAILRREGRVLVRRRRHDEHLPGVWEFPGGKIAMAEEPCAAAAREVREELGLEARGLTPRGIVEHDYPGRRLRLHVFEGTCTGEPSPPDGAAFAWVTPRELSLLPIPDANRSLVESLLFPG